MFVPDSWFRPFEVAWEMLLDFPRLPPLPKRKRRRAVSDAASLFWFPVIGALAGAVPALLGLFASGISNRIAGALVFGALSLAFLEMKDSGRGSSMLSALLLARLRGQNFSAVFPHLHANRDIYADPTAQMILLLLLAARFLLLFLLGFCRAPLWFAAVMIASFTLQGDLATNPGVGGEAPLLAVEPRDRGILWVLAAVLMALLMALLMLPLFPIAAVALCGATYILAGSISRKLLRDCGGVDPDAITLAGHLTEWIALFVGILWAIRL